MDPTSVSLLLVLVCILLWITHKYFSAGNIWREAGIPYASGFYTLYRMKDMLFKSFPDMILENYKKQKKSGHRLFGTYILGRPQLTVIDPEVIKQVLVKDFQNFMDRINFETGDKLLDSILSFARGETWKRIRSVLSPGFSTGKMKKMTETILDCAETLKKNIAEASNTGHPTDIKTFFSAFTMDAIASSAFGIKIDSHNDAENKFVVAGRKVFEKSNQMKMIFYFLFNKVSKFLRLKPNDIFNSRFFGKVAKKLAYDRQTSGESRNDFLQLLMDAMESSQNQAKQNAVHAGDEEQIHHENGEPNQKNDKNSDTFRKVLKSEDELVAQCILLFIGGFESLASTLTLAVYELAINQDIQDTLLQEIDQMTKNGKKSELTYDELQEHKYLDAVVSEIFRKYPLNLLLQRISTADCTLSEGDNEIKIPKGTTIMIPTYGMHHDPEYFPDPEKFDPERFAPEARASINPYVYTPFGVGPRNCIAMRFVIFEVKLCLAYILRHFRFHPCQKTQIPLKLPSAQASIVITEMFLKIEKRNRQT